jgi:PTS system mannose-specific IIA component
MVDFVLITHGSLALELLKTCEMIIGKQDRTFVITVQSSSSLQEIAVQLDKIVEGSQHSGVIIFTDMFGGSPSNIALAYLKSEDVEVITGVNLPMLIKAFALRQESNSVSDIGKKCVEAGRSSIRVAKDLLGYAKKDNFQS